MGFSSTIIICGFRFLAYNFAIIVLDYLGRLSSLNLYFLNKKFNILTRRVIIIIIIGVCRNSRAVVSYEY